MLKRCNLAYATLFAKFVEPRQHILHPWPTQLLTSCMLAPWRQSSSTSNQSKALTIGYHGLEMPSSRQSHTAKIATSPSNLHFVALQTINVSAELQPLGLQPMMTRRCRFSRGCNLPLHKSGPIPIIASSKLRKRWQHCPPHPWHPVMAPPGRRFLPLRCDFRSAQ